MKVYLAPLLWIAERYLNYNPLFIYDGKSPLLHQTEVVAKALFVKPTRLLIADAIGLGKTITGLRILRALNRYRRLGRVLIAVPSVLVDQWIEEMRSMGIAPRIIERKSLEFLSKHPELPSGWYIGSMDTLKQPEYMRILKKSKWDAIVVDEAHKLGITGTEPNQRLSRLGWLIRKNRDAAVLLLSATPHRGKPRDYLARLALVDPSLLEATKMGDLEKVFDNPEFYQRTHNIILFRRNKEDVNRMYEGRAVFKPCNMVAVLIEPNDTERNFLRTVTELATSYLGSYYAYMIDKLGWGTGRAQGIVALLRTLLVKRGLSSPSALVKTFGRLVKKRGVLIELIEKGYSPDEAEEKIAEDLERYSRRLDEILTGDVGELEEELDEEFDKLASYFNMLLDEKFREGLEKAREYAEAILAGKVDDSKLKALKKILNLVLQGSPEGLPEEFRDLPSKRKVIVFTEFKDTAYYLYDRLRRWAGEEFGDPNIVRVFTSDNRGEIEDIKKWLSEEGKKILITTDVAGEGLNLHYANVLVNYEIAWSPIRLEQRIGRVWRYGQDRTAYVFNLFLADALEREVAEVVFGKLYGISVSVGKLEPILGEKVFLSTIRNELLEHAVEEKETIAGLIPVEIDFKDRKVSLSESRIIELVTKDARGFVEAFVRALKKLLRELRYKRIFPLEKSVEEVKDELRHLTGFRNAEEAVETAKNIVDGVSELLGLDAEERGDKILLRSRDGVIYELPTNNPEDLLRRLANYFKADESVRYFVFQGDEREVILLAEAEVSLGGEVRYREPVGIVANFETYNITVLRGKALIQKLIGLLPKSIPVDEIYGLNDVRSAIPQIISASHNTLYESELKRGAVKIVRMLRDYEETKRKLGGQPFFNVGEPRVNVKEPAFIFISSAFLPEAGEVVSREVWGWAEDEAMPIVFNYEGLSGREAVRVSGYEHYDVRSVRRGENGRILEERFIEVKTKMRRTLNFSLKNEEAKLAEEKGEAYWLYIVYGVRTEKPVILAIRDPLKRLPFRRRVAIERREEYYFGIGGTS